MPPASGLVWVAMPPIRIFQRPPRRRIVPIKIIRIIITAMAVARTTAVLTVADIMAAAATAAVAAVADITDFIFR